MLPKPSRSLRVLIADDDKLICELLAKYVTMCGHEVVATVTGGGLSVIQSFAKLAPEVVLLDVLMPRFNGITVCHALLSRRPDVKVILMSGMVDESHPFVDSCGATAFLHKPMHVQQLSELLESLCQPESMVA